NSSNSTTSASTPFCALCLKPELAGPTAPAQRIPKPPNFFGPFLNTALTKRTTRPVKLEPGWISLAFTRKVHQGGWATTCRWELPVSSHRSKRGLRSLHPSTSGGILRSSWANLILKVVRHVLREIIRKIRIATALSTPHTRPRLFSTHLPLRASSTPIFSVPL